MESRRMPNEVVRRALHYLVSALPNKVEMKQKIAEDGRENAENRWDRDYWIGYNQALTEIYEHLNPIRCEIKNNLVCYKEVLSMKKEVLDKLKKIEEEVMELKKEINETEPQPGEWYKLSNEDYAIVHKVTNDKVYYTKIITHPNPRLYKLVVNKSIFNSCFEGPIPVVTEEGVTQVI